MLDLVQIICDTEQEADFARIVCQQKGYKNITKRQISEIHVMEVEGTPPNYVFSGKYSRSAQQLWVVSAER